MDTFTFFLGLDYRSCGVLLCYNDKGRKAVD